MVIQSQNQNFNQCLSQVGRSISYCSMSPILDVFAHLRGEPIVTYLHSGLAIVYIIQGFIQHWRVRQSAKARSHLICESDCAVPASN